MSELITEMAENGPSSVLDLAERVNTEEKHYALAGEASPAPRRAVAPPPPPSPPPASGATTGPLRRGAQAGAAPAAAPTAARPEPSVTTTPISP